MWLISLQIIHASIASLLTTNYFELHDIEKFTGRQLLFLCLVRLDSIIDVLYLLLHPSLLSVALLIFLYVIYRDIHKLPLTLNSRR